MIPKKMIGARELCPQPVGVSKSLGTVPVSRPRGFSRHPVTGDIIMSDGPLHYYGPDAKPTK